MSLTEDLLSLPGCLGPVVIYGPAATQGSKRILQPTKPGQKARLIEQCKRSRPWRQQVILAMRECRPDALLDEAVHVELRVYQRRPLGHYGTGKNAGVLKAREPRFPMSGHDLDKVARAVLDAGKVAGWWIDDSRVASLDLLRLYTEGEEKVVVTAWPLEVLAEPRYGPAPGEGE